MRYYAVLDTNVLVSAMLKHNSIPAEVLAEALNGDIIPVLNEDILAEYEDVLKRPKFRFDERKVDVFLDELKRRAVYSDCGLIEDEIPDPKDVVFYAVLMEKRKDEDAYLVTGNIKHFPIKTYVVTPREMLDIVAEGK
ncbi:MAG: putative toxin-antitoxin system toxin component, PIN family [Clostridiales bacterium]|nr:putative toxin-antitoxin system toxin component, PIN family [Clostridiales bacterium]